MKTMEIGRGPIDDRRRAEEEGDASADGEREPEADLPTKEIATRKMARDLDDDVPTREVPPKAKLVRAEAPRGERGGVSLMPFVVVVVLAAAGAGAFIATRARPVTNPPAGLATSVRAVAPGPTTAVLTAESAQTLTAAPSATVEPSGTASAATSVVPSPPAATHAPHPPATGAPAAKPTGSWKPEW